MESARGVFFVDLQEKSERSSWNILLYVEIKIDYTPLISVLIFKIPKGLKSKNNNWYKRQEDCVKCILHNTL